MTKKNTSNDANPPRLHKVIAANAGLDIIQSFLEESSVRNDINTKDAQGHTPLYLAVLQGNAPLVKLLYSLGADLTHEKSSLFKLAAKQNNPRLLKELEELSRPDKNKATKNVVSNENAHVLHNRKKTTFSKQRNRSLRERILVQEAAKASNNVIFF